MRYLLLIILLISQLLAQAQEFYKVGITKTWPPFNFLDKDKKLQGIAVDYWKLIEKKSGIQSTINQSENFSEVLKKIKEKKYDIVINTTSSKKRDKYANFSKTYEKFPIAIVTKEKENFIPKISLLNGKKIAVGRDYSTHFLLKQKYPDIDFVIVKDTKEALELVKSGVVFAAADILPCLQYYLFELNDGLLKINGITDINFELKIMLRDDLKELLPIVNKAIDSITIDERSIIYAKWLLNPNRSEINYKLFFKISLALLSLILIFIYWNIKLQKAKKTIIEEKNKLKEILSKLPIPILIVDNKTKKILFANQFSTKLYRTTYDNLLGKAIDVLYIKENQRKKILDSMNKDGSLINFESSFKLMDGSVITGLLSYIPIMYEDKKCRIGVVTDITELKEAQKELKGLNDTLEEKISTAISKNKEQQIFLFQQSRLAQMGEMISMIAHQWRQPLNILSLIIQTLQISYERKALTKESLDESIKDATNQIKLMSRTIEDFMTFFKPDKKIEVFDINKQIENSVKLLNKLLLDKDIQIELNLDGEIDVLGYSNEFGQVIINMIVNAKDAIVDNNISNGKIIIESKIKNKKVLIEVRDNAKGVDALVIEKIFNPYFSTKLEKNGTGLGLYMSKLIVEEHMKGEISVKNIENGACFQIQLNVYKD